VTAKIKRLVVTKCHDQPFLSKIESSTGARRFENSIAPIKPHVVALHRFFDGDSPKDLAFATNSQRLEAFQKAARRVSAVYPFPRDEQISLETSPRILLKTAPLQFLQRAAGKTEIKREPRALSSGELNLQTAAEKIF
jgi:hypothetical protein